MRNIRGYLAFLLVFLSLIAGCQNSVASENDSILEVSKAHGVYSEPTWSDDGSKLAVKLDNQISIFDLEKKSWANHKMEGYSLIQSPLEWNGEDLYFVTSDYAKDFFKSVTIMEWNMTKDKMVPIESKLPTVYSISKNNNKQIVYSIDNLETEEPGDKRVYLKDLNNMKSKVFLKEGYDLEWDPSGSKLAYIDDGIYIYDVNRKVKEKIYSTKDEEILNELSWSPSGRWIAFKQGGYNSGIGLYILSVDGEEKHQLISKNVSYLSWSPKGDKIAYTTIGAPGVNDVFLIEVPDKYTY